MHILSPSEGIVVLGRCSSLFVAGTILASPYRVSSKIIRERKAKRFTRLLNRECANALVELTTLTTVFGHWSQSHTHSVLASGSPRSWGVVTWRPREGDSEDRYHLD